MFKLNFETDEVSLIHSFEQELNRAPTIVEWNDDQDLVLVATPEVGLFLAKSGEKTFSEQYFLDKNLISKLKSATYD